MAAHCALRSLFALLFAERMGRPSAGRRA